MIKLKKKLQLYKKELKTKNCSKKESKSKYKINLIFYERVRLKRKIILSKG